MKINLISVILLFTLAGTANAVVPINNSSTFPYVITSTNTYQLTENISCPMSCIVVQGTADNTTIDLNGHTMTYGAANAVTVPNADFESWTGASPDSWEVISGSVSSVPAIDWGEYDLQTVGATTLRSASFSINSDQTYQAWAFIKGSSSASATIKILNAVDNSVLASEPITGAMINRGFAVAGDEYTYVFQYKPPSAMQVRLELETVGAYSLRIPEINMAPKNHFAVVSYNGSSSYRREVTADLVAEVSGMADNLTIKNGTIIQGGGKASYSPAIYLTNATNIPGAMIDNVNITTSGPNSGGVIGAKSVTNSVLNINSKRIFNRMNGPIKGAGIVMAGLDAEGTMVVNNTTVNNYPQYGIMASKCRATRSSYSDLSVTNSTFHGDGLVTEPYFLRVVGITDMQVSGNTVDPVQGKSGRGILIDTASGCSLLEGSNGTVTLNKFLNIFEDQNLEYNPTGVAGVAVRIRNYGQDDESFDGLTISRNIINGYALTSDQATNGININAYAPRDNISIADNSVSLSAAGGSRVSAVILQNVNGEFGGSYEVAYNRIVTNDRGVQFAGSDGPNTNEGVSLHHNTISNSTGNPLYIYDANYSQKNNDIFCNKFIVDDTSNPVYTEATTAPFNGTQFDYNLFSTQGGYDIRITTDVSSQLLFYGSGSIGVTGGGGVGYAASAKNGSEGCYLTSGPRYSFLTSGKRYARIKYTKD